MIGMSMRQRLYPAPGQVEVLSAHCDSARFVWNLAVEQHMHWRPGRSPAPGYAVQARQLTEARCAFDWLAAGSIVVQQQALRDFERAARAFMAGATRRPAWRKKGRNEGFNIVSLGRHRIRRLGRRWAEVHVPKLGYVRFRLTYDWGQLVPAARSARVSKDRSGAWWVSFVVPHRVFVRSSTGMAVGVDRGVCNSVATSDGLLSSPSHFTAGEERRAAGLQQQLERQRPRSRRRDRTRRELASLHGRVARRRREWVEQVTTHLVRDYDLIGLEDLKVGQRASRPRPRPDEVAPGSYLPNGAAAKSGLNKRIREAGWGLFERRLVDKATRTAPGEAALVVKVAPHNTSTTCTQCGYSSSSNRKNQAMFVCEVCGHAAHADTNAAINIRERALRIVDVSNGGQADRQDACKPPTYVGRREPLGAHVGGVPRSSSELSRADAEQIQTVVTR
jgi:transposase